MGTSTAEYPSPCLSVCWAWMAPRAGESSQLTLSAHPEKSLLFSFPGLLFLPDGISPEEGVSLPSMKALPFPLGHVLLTLCALFAPSLGVRGRTHLGTLGLISSPLLDLLRAPCGCDSITNRSCSSLEETCGLFTASSQSFYR